MLRFGEEPRTVWANRRINPRQVLVLNRKREKGNACTERGVFARFRFNDLKEAARRRMRALCKLNGAKGRRCGASGLCGGAQQMIRRAWKLAIAEKCCEESV